MPLAPDQAVDILIALIRRPDVPAPEVPRIWKTLLDTYREQFAPPASPPRKRRRRFPKGTGPTGWPSGVPREEYRLWKDALMAQGVTEGLTPHRYKALVEAGKL